ncbi:hypothetical protein H6P81_020630 [Aristolochia fimbriata]|uniref:Cucumisin n=1 Tax=Aristolochia fimbriata TaxID=158543 RepID=A0AAV7DUX8_ARIFI|nr:hypothetical protein H6P81_020630 [Aristolochia fimbriata]
MAVMMKWSSSLLFSLLIALLLVPSALCQSDKKIHVVYMGARVEDGVPAVSSLHHNTMLENALGSTAAVEESLIYSYKSFNGFAAKLTDEEAARFAGMEGVVSVIPNRVFKLHTTRSWDFMGLPRMQKSGGSSGNQGDIIVALLDTGVWPESESFGDEGFGPPPAKWKGSCAANFTCNNKLIGARYYHSEGTISDPDVSSPRDSEGHGSHTASTAAGREVSGASFYGLGEGVARGAVPGARIAMYKVCWSDGCYLADILAAFDDAIADGVDVISVSLGFDSPLDYFDDPIAIGSFHAMKHGILTSNSAGNSGPGPRTISNITPWTVSVAASSIDRTFFANVVLGNGRTLTGISINGFVMNGTYPLIYAGNAANVSAGIGPETSKYCHVDTLNKDKVRGKIVICDTTVAGSSIVEADGAGYIMSDRDASTIFFDNAFSYPLPATVIGLDDAAAAIAYSQSTENPFATIVSETWRDITAPRVVSFSSRGPSLLGGDILKPDITAPGVSILAAWSPMSSPSVDAEDPRRVNYNIISGTSMSCPHVSGAAAYVKAHRPTWSPSAIKSALMTTAAAMDRRKNYDAEFAYGAGHIDPVKAVDPGLVYEAFEQDYVDYLCSHGYNGTNLRLVTGDSSACTRRRAMDLNYPSFSLPVQDGHKVEKTFYRTVTNVAGKSTYRVKVNAPAGIEVAVQPAELSFAAAGERRSFRVAVKGGAISQTIISAEIVWTDGTHVVRSPLVVYTRWRELIVSVIPNKMYQLHTTRSWDFMGLSLTRSVRCPGRHHRRRHRFRFSSTSTESIFHGRLPEQKLIFAQGGPCRTHQEERSPVKLSTDRVSNMGNRGYLCVRTANIME